MSLTQSLSRHGQIAMEEVTFHFTHARTRGIFSSAALVWAVGFGFLSVLLAYVTPLSYALLGVSLCGFTLFMSVELSGAVIGFVYEHSFVELVKSVGVFVVIVGEFILGCLYFWVGGVFVGAAFMIAFIVVLPEAFTPLIALGYILFSIAWASTESSWLDGSRDTTHPPISLMQWVLDFARHIR